MKDNTRLEGLEKILYDYIEKEAPVKLCYEDIAMQLSYSKSELKTAIIELMKKNMIEKKSVKTIGASLFIKNNNLLTTVKKEKEIPPFKSTLYLVDTENVSVEHFFQDGKYLTPRDTVVLFLTQHSRGVSNPQLLHKLFNISAKVETIFNEVSGKNALDFILICEVSLRLSANPNQNVQIITKDKAYSAAIQHLNKKLKLSEHQVLRTESLAIS